MVKQFTEYDFSLKGSFRIRFVNPSYILYKGSAPLFEQSIDALQICLTLSVVNISPHGESLFAQTITWFINNSSFAGVISDSVYLRGWGISPIYPMCIYCISFFKTESTQDESCCLSAAALTASL